MVMTRLKFGDAARDRITGFVGVVIGRGEFLSGGSKILLQRRCGPAGDLSEPIWFGEGRLTRLGDGISDSLALSVDADSLRPAKQQSSDAAQRKLERWQTPLGIFVKKYGADNIAGKLRCTGRAVRGWVSGFHPGPQLARRLVALAVANGVQLTLEDLLNQAVICGR
jgi:hypothetical protein